jgi:dolichol kinase
MTSARTHGLRFDAQVELQNRLRALSREILKSLDSCQKPRLRDPNWGSQFQSGLDSLTADIRDFVGRFSGAIGPRVADRLVALERGFAAYRESISSGRPCLTELKSRYQTLCTEYEAALLEIRRTGFRSWVGGGHLKPINYWRNLFHAMNASIAFALYQWVLSREQALVILGAVAVPAIGLEVGRKFSPRLNAFLVDRVFGIISRPKERHTVNSATWYLISLILTCAFFPKEAVLLAILILGYSDPIASLVGKRWGATKVRGQKSLQGTLAFLVSATVATGTFAFVSGLEFSGWSAGVWFLGVPLAATAAELFGDRIDDNFGILLAAGGVAALALGLR